MKQETFTTIVLHAEEGKFLTQAADVPIEARVIGTTIALGKNDSPENWKEISAYKAKMYEREKNAAAESYINDTNQDFEYEL